MEERPVLVENSLVPNHHSHLRDTEHDGRVVNTSRDPPGQQSVYILPGNQEEESYRVTTFARFPANSSVDIRKLAENGFCYTGYKDRVKCFSCGIQIDTWQSTDDPTSRIWHFQNCEFYTGIRERNIPLRRLLRQATSMPRNTPPPSPRRMARTPSAGAILMGHTASTSAHSNRGASSSQSFDRNEMNEHQLRDLFPCHHPVNPHMRNSNARLATFEVGWDAERVRASPQELADCGLYYLGIRDKVKCWYCNGGLQNWDYEDEPWFEHAKWFPTCEYLLQRKGPQFVHGIVAQFPNLRRPLLRNPSRRHVMSGLNRRRFHGGLRPGSQHRSAPPETPIEIIDPREEMKKMKKKVKEEMTKSSDLVTHAMEMGFERKQIKAAFKRKLQMGSTLFTRFGDLVDSIVNHEGHIESESSDSEDIELEESASTLTPRSVVEEVRQLEEEKLCKICRVNNVQVVFLPCGHLVSCLSCSPNATNCPVCKVAITDRVRTYAS